MAGQSPSLKDLATVLYRPRETMRRVLDSTDRWTAGVVALAAICGSFGDPDIRRVEGFTLPGLLATAALGLIGTAIVWIIAVFVFAWVATIVGRRLGGEATVADVRAAIAWGLVPQIWAIVFRIPIAHYLLRFVPAAGDEQRALVEFVKQGGCSVAVLLFAMQFALYAWVIYVSSNCAGEALRFSSWKGLATLAITFAIPIIVGIAAYFSLRT